MAINIGTNINYQGHEYLDKRQGLANSEDDLKNWSTPVPNGFEVYVNGLWYTYDENNEISDITGKFKKREDEDLKAQVELNTTDINDIMHEVFKLTMSVNPGSLVHEIGQSINPNITWILNYKNAIVLPDSATVNNTTTGINENYTSFTDPNSITQNKTYTIKANYKDMSCSSSVSYLFKYKKYFGVSDKTNLSNSDILSFNMAWADSWKMGSTNFDCSGGKYPYYLIPTECYNESEFKMWVGGFRNTDLIISTKTVTNQYNKQHEYTVIRLGTLQTGVLSIEFK